MKMHSHGDFPEVNHDINVTPFIDVMLVLLIIFMVAAPLATVDVPIDLPVSRAGAPPQSEPPVVVTLDRSLMLSLGNDRIARPSLADRLVTRTRGDRDTRIFVRADRAVPYGDVMALMDDLRAAGFLKVALVGAEGGSARP